MGLFNFFKKSTDNGIPGPTFYDGLTEHIKDPAKLKPNEWRRRLVTPAGQTRFNINFYGKAHEKHPEIIVGTHFAPSLIVAVDVTTGEEILLFDGCRHGYNAMFCDTFSEEQIKNRSADDIYVDKDGLDIFEIVVSVYAGGDEELSAEAGENGLIELPDGNKIAVRDAFGAIHITAINQNGRAVIVVSEELA